MNVDVGYDRPFAGSRVAASGPPKSIRGMYNFLEAIEVGVNHIGLFCFDRYIVTNCINSFYCHLYKVLSLPLLRVPIVLLLVQC